MTIWAYTKINISIVYVHLAINIYLEYLLLLVIFTALILRLF